MPSNLYHKLLEHLDTDFKKAIAISVAAHLLFLLSFVVIPGLFTSKKIYFGPVQPVSLTVGAMKGPGKGGSGARAAAVKTPAKKTAAAKKTNKLKSEKILPLKTPPKDTYAKKGAKDQKPEKSLKDRISEKLAAVEKDTKDESPKKPAEKEPEGDASSGSSLKISSGSGSMTAGIGDGFGDTDLPFAWYLDLIQTKIADNWEEPSGLLVQSDTVSVVVFFRVDRSGAVSNLSIKTSAGREDIDNSVIEAVKRAQPLPPLPDEYKGDFLDINIKFDLNR
ncbi:MAG TPA: energy transducer TonB [bacterium]|nr:energy transducer TonB [bacterium]